MIFRNANDVARWRLCVGCGACVSVCERNNLILEDVHDQGIRPIARGNVCEECGNCVQICPGLGAPRNSTANNEDSLVHLQNDWGPILEMWEGYAANPQIRYGGSSGGAATAIALYCLDAGLAGGVLHVGKNEDEPWRNRTVISRTHFDLLARTGSRYSPASPCEDLRKIQDAASPTVFIGKPCDIQGLRKAEALSPQLQEKVCVSLGIFCAGTPSTAATLELLSRLRVPQEAIRDLRFRGNGWPGSFAVRLRDESDFAPRLNYKESWGFLQAYRPFRCYLCPDGTSEFADISCGDPWYRDSAGSDPGRSLILVRTQRGREILESAVQKEYLYLERVEPQVLELSQKNLLMKRRAIWGRLLTMKAFGLPVPCYEDFPLFANWLELPFKEKSRSIIGTARRILQRNYREPLPRDLGS